MDPLSVTGVALGGTSLLFQVFDGAVKGFNFIIAAVEMPASCEKYREWLIIEYNRTLAWAEAAGIIEKETGEKIAISLGANPLEILAVVSRIDVLLREFTDLNNQYHELHPEEGITKKEQEQAREKASHEDIMKKVSSLALVYEKGRKKREHMIGTNHLHTAFSGLVDLAKHPRRIRWVIRDEGVFTALLKDLHFRTERLRELMDDYRSDKILQIVSESYLEMVQMRKGTEELQRLITTTSLMSEYCAKSNKVGDSHPAHHDILRDLVRLKCLNTPADDLNKERLTKSRFTAFDKLVVWDTSDDQERTKASLKMVGGEKRVWIEWKPYIMEFVKDDDEEQQIHPGTVERTAALAGMLQLEKPSSFCTPRCLGFFDDWERAKKKRAFGWIYEMPPETTDVVSLFTIMENPAREPKTPRPSLNVRVSLAKRLVSSVLYLHAVDWLHKSIRSANVIFLYGNGQVDLEQPNISGFEYSRPDANRHTSDRAAPKFTVDMYRWPDIQGDVDREKRSCKIYDIYALGLLLLEVAYWKPLHRILDIEIESSSFEEVRDIRKNLLEAKPEILADLRVMVGDRFHDVVRRCIVAQGDDAFGVLVKDQQDGKTDGAVGLRLQEAFMEKAVDVLHAVRI